MAEEQWEWGMGCPSAHPFPFLSPTCLAVQLLWNWEEKDERGGGGGAEGVKTSQSYWTPVGISDHLYCWGGCPMVGPYVNFLELP